MEDLPTSPKLKTRAVILRCPDTTFLSLLEMIRSTPDCFVIFSKTSQNKLVVNEEAY